MMAKGQIIFIYSLKDHLKYFFFTIISVIFFLYGQMYNILLYKEFISLEQSSVQKFLF